MQLEFWFDKLSFWGVFLFIFLLVIVSVWCGVFIGYRRQKSPKHETGETINSTVNAIFALLAFFLAFSFAIATNRLLERQHLLLREVNSIGTTYLRASFLPAPYDRQSRQLLEKYVQIRVDVIKADLEKNPEILQQAIQKSDGIQDQLWQIVNQNKNALRNPIGALYVSSLNETIDLQTSRITFSRYRLKPIVWYILFFLITVSMLTLGYQCGLLGKSSIIVSIILALTFAAVMLLINDLNHIHKGTFRVGQEPMIELYKTVRQDIHTNK